jgi:hypothetical protein
VAIAKFALNLVDPGPGAKSDGRLSLEGGIPDRRARWRRVLFGAAHEAEDQKQTWRRTGRNEARAGWDAGTGLAETGTRSRPVAAGSAAADEVREVEDV